MKNIVVTRILSILLLLFAAVPVAWADGDEWSVWDGKTKTFPEHMEHTYEPLVYHIHIHSAAELAYIIEHFNEAMNQDGTYPFCNQYYYLDVNIDMGDTPWTPIGNKNGSITELDLGEFHGNGHTIRFKIKDATENYQGLFAKIGLGGRVYNLHVEGDISCSRSRLVGGIAGENNGKIANCWVSANVRSDWKEPGSAYTAKVGGIVGENNGTIEYCCVSGNVTNNDADVGGLVGYNSGDGKVRHSTFHGTRYSTHSQEYTIIGDQDGTIDSCYDIFQSSELTSNQKMYNYALKYPFAINVTTEGEGAYQLSAGDEKDITRWYPGAAVKLTKILGSIQSLSIKDAEGKVVNYNGDINDAVTFTMPRKDVNITIAYGKGTEKNPFIIDSADEWDRFVNMVNSGKDSFRGEYVKLTNDISVSRMMGESDVHSFQGTFDGAGHTLTVDFNTSEPRTAPFRHVLNATIKNLTVTGTITTSAQFAAGIVSESYGALRLEGCRSSVTINSSVQGDGTHGGLVSRLSGQDNSIVIAGCVFDGSFATTGGTTNCGGFIGWPVYNKPSITHSLMVPKSVAAGMLNNTFARWHTTYSPNITKSLFVATDNLPADQGTPAVAYATAPNNLGNLEKDYGVIKAHQNGFRFDGKYYMDSRVMLPGEGTEENPYTIGSEEDWKIFVGNIDRYHYYTGNFVKLTKDISVTTPASFFDGIFDGDGHTLTITLQGEWPMIFAPFVMIDNATIKNLKTAGSFKSEFTHVLGGIVGLASGNTTIENCSSSVAMSIPIYSSSGIEAKTGGIVSTVSASSKYSAKITGCSFTGSITYTRAEASGGGGIVGNVSDEGLVTISQCVFAPSAINMDKMETFNSIAGGSLSHTTITDCYHTEPKVKAQGVKISSITGGEGVTVANAGAVRQEYDVDGLTFYETGLKVGDVLYAASGESVSLKLGHDERDGFVFRKYTSSGGTLSGTTLTMADADVTVDAVWMKLAGVTILGEPKYVTSFYDGTQSYRLTGGALAYTVDKDGIFHRIGDESDVIPAGTAVIILSDTTSFDLVALDSTDVTARSGNILLGTDTEIPCPAGSVYVLGIVGDTPGFYKYTGSTLPAGKAYYVVNE